MDTKELELRNATPEEVAKAQAILDFFEEQVPITMKRADWIRMELCILAMKKQARAFLANEEEQDITDGALGMNRDQSLKALVETANTINTMETLIGQMHMSDEMQEEADRLSAETKICFCGNCEIVVDVEDVYSRERINSKLERMLRDAGFDPDALLSTLNPTMPES